MTTNIHIKFLNFANFKSIWLKENKSRLIWLVFINIYLDLLSIFLVWKVRTYVMNKNIAYAKCEYSDRTYSFSRKKMNIHGT